MRAILLAVLLIPTPAFAMQGDWIDRAIDSMTDHRPAPQVRSYVKRRVVRPHKPKPEPVHERPQRDFITICLPAIRVVGSQWVTEAGAEDSAKKAWMEKARWLYGESAMDLASAKDYARCCSRSSIGEVAGQMQHRCEVEATPCRPRFQR